MPLKPPSIEARIRAALASNPAETNKSIARRLGTHFWRVHDQRNRLGIPQLRRGYRKPAPDRRAS